MIIETSLVDIVPKELMAALSEEAVEAILGNIANAARNHWIGLAQKHLHTSRNDYVNSIQEVEFKPGMAIITLVGQPANLIENGMPEQDLREWLLGPRVPEAPPGQKGKRRAKDGHFYRSIPFRHGTPGTGGSVGKAMGDPYRGVIAGARQLGKDVYKKAKKLAPTTSRKGRIAYGGKLPSGIVPKLKKHHKTDIYAGMVKLQKTYKSATQSQYMTFRTISENVTTGWIRPQTDPRGFAGRTSDFIARLAPQAFESYISGATKVGP